MNTHFEHIVPIFPVPKAPKKLVQISRVRKMMLRSTLHFSPFPPHG